MLRLDVREVKTRLFKCLAKVEKGETILLCRGNQPIAEIRPLPPNAGNRGLSDCSKARSNWALNSSNRFLTSYLRTSTAKNREALVRHALVEPA